MEVISQVVIRGELILNGDPLVLLIYCNAASIIIRLFNTLAAE